MSNIIRCWRKGRSMGNSIPLFVWWSTHARLGKVSFSDLEKLFSCENLQEYRTNGGVFYSSCGGLLHWVFSPSDLRKTFLNGFLEQVTLSWNGHVCFFGLSLKLFHSQVKILGDRNIYGAGNSNPSHGLFVPAKAGRLPLFFAF